MNCSRSFMKRSGHSLGSKTSSPLSSINSLQFFTSFLLFLVSFLFFLPSSSTKSWKLRMLYGLRQLSRLLIFLFPFLSDFDCISGLLPMYLWRLLTDCIRLSHFAQLAIIQQNNFFYFLLYLYI